MGRRGLSGNIAVCTSSIPLAPSVHVTTAGCWEGADCLVTYPAPAYTAPLLSLSVGGLSATAATAAAAAPAPGEEPSPPPHDSGGGFSGRSNLLLAFVVVALVIFGVLGLLRLWRMHRLQGRVVSLSGH